MVNLADCELCRSEGGELIVNTSKFRIILVDDANYPGFCRVIWNSHVQEMTDLSINNRSTIMQAVCKVEEAIRDVMHPDKINLASLGNMVPHLHWHVIPRYKDDAHFPNPIWAASEKKSGKLEAKRAMLPELRKALISIFSEY